MRTSVYITTGQPPGRTANAWLHARHLWQEWRRRSRMRAQLRAMDVRALADIGMEPEAARQEHGKFFWQR